jgi:hypothetical protein
MPETFISHDTYRDRRIKSSGILRILDLQNIGGKNPPRSLVTNYLARFQTNVLEPPANLAGVVYISSSAVRDVMTRFKSSPF